MSIEKAQQTQSVQEFEKNLDKAIVLLSGIGLCAGPIRSFVINNLGGEEIEAKVLKLKLGHIET